MKQGLLAFQYQEEKSTTGMTALSGLMTYVELMHAAGLRSSVERRVGLRGGGQGPCDLKTAVTGRVTMIGGHPGAMLDAEAPRFRLRSASSNEVD